MKIAFRIVEHKIQYNEGTLEYIEQTGRTLHGMNTTHNLPHVKPEPLYETTTTDTEQRKETNTPKNVSNITITEIE
jgi:hypothetical protein